MTLLNGKKGNKSAWRVVPLLAVVLLAAGCKQPATTGSAGIADSAASAASAPPTMRAGSAPRAP